MTKKAVLWDMDGTLIDSEPLHARALKQAMATQGLIIPDDLEQRVTGLAADAVYDWLCQELGLSVAFEGWIALKYSAYLDRVHQIRPFAKALELWRTLDRAGIAQAIVSNSDRRIVDANLTHAGIAKARQITVSRNDVRHGKPNPEPFLRAAWLLGTAPKDCIVLEDSPTGALAGLAAGMTVFFVPHTPLMPPTGVQRLRDFDEIFALATT